MGTLAECSCTGAVQALALCSLTCSQCTSAPRLELELNMSSTGCIWAPATEPALARAP